MTVSYPKNVLILFQWLCYLGVYGTAGIAMPQQIHLSIGTARNSIFVTFISVGSNDTSEVQSMVQYRLSSENKTRSITAVASTYTAGGWVGLIHRAAISGLVRGNHYTYRCGITSVGQLTVWSNWTEIGFFSRDKAGNETVFAVLADLDAREAAGDKTIAAVTEAIKVGEIDALLHAGDIAYIKGATNEGTYDAYFNQIQGAAARVPYHVAVGNQEHWNNFAGYEARFTMPGPNNFWHSVDLGPVHVLFVSTEHDYGANSEQITFAEADLNGVNREVTPWVLVLLHRPLYCSTNDYYDCEIASVDHLRPAFEQLFLEKNVDVVVAGHVHNYERTTPVFNGTIVEHGPIHITVGNAGDIEGMTTGWAHPTPEWSQYRSTALGWTRWTATRSSLRIELVSSNDGARLDSLILKR